MVLRITLLTAVLAIAANQALANGHGGGHGGGAAPPPPPSTDPPAKIVITKTGSALVDPKGMTLYFYERDTHGTKSTCEGKCTEMWTPLSAPDNARPVGDFTVIIRTDGSKMWAYRYRPLYTSVADKAPGDAKGTAMTLQWHIARPEQ